MLAALVVVLRTVALICCGGSRRTYVRSWISISGEKPADGCTSSRRPREALSRTRRSQVVQHLTCGGTPCPLRVLCVLRLQPFQQPNDTIDGGFKR